MDGDYRHERDERRAKPRVPILERDPAFSTVLIPVMREYLQVRGLDFDLAWKNGWYPSMCAGDGELRIVIPATSRVEGHTFWQARSMNKESEKRYQSSHGARLDALIVVLPRLVPKYLSLSIIIVEGPMDALAAAECGGIGVALMGNTPSRDVLEHLSDLIGLTRALIVPDKDSLTSGTMLSARLASEYKRTSMVCILPARYKDLAEVPYELRQDMIDTWRSGWSKEPPENFQVLGEKDGE